MNRIFKFAICGILALFIVSCEKEKDIAITSVSISQPTAEMLIGETIQLSATILPNDATDKTVVWASSKQSVATISSTGLVTAIAEGSSTITATAGGKFGSCTVTVSKRIVEVGSIELNKSSLALTEGDSEILAAVVKPNDATDKTVAWYSSDASIAAIDNGKVTAIKEGSATITARAGEKSATCAVTVSKKVIAITEVTLNKTYLELVEGDEVTLTATIKPDNATDKTVVWSSSDASIATIDNGKVTAIKEGSATIIARAGEKNATCAVTVAKKVIAVTEVTLDKTSLELVEGDEITLTAIVKPDNATDKTVTWTTSDASIATVQDGLVKAVKAGTAIVSAVAGDITSTCSVVIKQKVPKQKLSITVSAGTLKETIEALGIDILNVQELTVSGELNGNDLAIIRTMAGNDKYFIQEGQTPSDGCLEVLDMSGSILIPGSEIYMYQYGQNYSITNYNEIPHDAFRACVRLKKVILPNNCTMASNASFFACYALESIVIPTSVKTIPKGCFSACRSLKEVSIPDVTTIKERAFWGCTSLTSVELGNIQKIEGASFGNCISLVRITIPSSNSYFCIEDNALLTKDKTILYYYPGGLNGYYTTPASVEQIFNYAFCGSNLKKVEISNGTRIIGSYAFYLSNIESVIISDTVSEIGSIFMYRNPRLNHLELPNRIKSVPTITECPALEEIVIPEGITSVSSSYCFNDCTSLRKITIPSSLSTINRGTFAHTVITEVHCNSSQPQQFDIYPFLDNATIYVPIGAKSSYQADANWGKYSIVEE